MSRQQKILKHQFKFAIKCDLQNLLVIIDDSDISTWYFKILNLPEPYLDGEYIFKLKADESFPKTPPIFSFLTPNGVFEPGGKICISIGEFHKKDYDEPDGSNPSEGSYGWRPALGMIGFAREVINGMIVSDHLMSGVRIVKSTIAQKVDLANDSVRHNRKTYHDLNKLFDEVEIDHPDLKSVLKKQHRIQLKKDHQNWRNGTVSIADNNIFKKYLPDQIYAKIHAQIGDPNMRDKLSKLILSQDYSIQLELVSDGQFTV
jgi:ubiquitin-conjugating enzyme E2 J2